jgi:hypothetical protein
MKRHGWEFDADGASLAASRHLAIFHRSTERCS